MLVDDGGYLHLFLENANGTSPHAHIKYYFDPNAIQYITKNDWFYDKNKSFFFILFLFDLNILP